MNSFQTVVWCEKRALCRARVFRKAYDSDPGLVQHVEDYLVNILNGEAPGGWRFEDVEETFVVDKKTGKGKWTPSSDVYAAAAKSRKSSGNEKSTVSSKASAAAKDDKIEADEDEDDDDDDVDDMITDI